MLQPSQAKRCPFPCNSGPNWQRNFYPALMRCPNPKLNRFGFKKLRTGLRKWIKGFPSAFLQKTYAGKQTLCSSELLL